MTMRSSSGLIATDTVDLFLRRITDVHEFVLVQSTGALALSQSECQIEEKGHGTHHG